MHTATLAEISPAARIRPLTAAGYTYLTIDEQLVSGPRSLEEFVRYSLDGQGPSALYDPAFAHVGIGSARSSSAEADPYRIPARLFLAEDRTVLEIESSGGSDRGGPRAGKGRA